MIWIRIGSLVMALGVAVGAFGAHGLKNHLETLGTTEAFKTAVLYHLIHGLGLILVGVILTTTSKARLQPAGLLMTAGIILFSGSLYALAVTGTKMFGMITPLGGLAFIAAWVVVFLNVG